MPVFLIEFLLSFGIKKPRVLNVNHEFNFTALSIEQSQV